MGVIRCPHCQEMIPDDFAHCGFCGKDVNVKNDEYMLQIGTVLQDRYYIGAAIGQGGFGITYSCCDLRLDMKVAIKEFYPDRLVKRDSADSNDVVLINPSKKYVYDHEMSKCLLEARTLGDFADDPGVVRVSDIFNQNNTVYIVMEYLEGMTLEQFRKCNPDVDFDFCYKMLSPVIKVLEHIHERGLVHRDISPSNIMVLPDGRAKLLDFGSASRFDKVEEDDEILVLRQGYSPIEQYQKGMPSGPWSDVYSFCATFYYMLTGVNPCSADDRVGDDQLEKPSVLGATILEDQENALMHGLVLNPKFRTRSMKQLADEMELRVPVARSEQLLNLKEQIEAHMAEGFTGMVDVSGANKTVNSTVNNNGNKVRLRKTIIGLIAAAMCVLICICAVIMFVRSKQAPKITSSYLIEESGNNLNASENVKVTIKTAVEYRAYKNGYSDYPESYKNEETVEVWSGQDDSIYLKNTSTVEDGYIAYMIMDHVKGDTYKLGKRDANNYSLDNGYESFMVPMFLSSSCLNGGMQLSEDMSKLNGKYCYTVSGELSSKIVLEMVNELNIYDWLPEEYIKLYGLVPKGNITAYFDSESFELKRISITLLGFDLDSLAEVSNKHFGYEKYRFDEMTVTMNVDYSYGEKAELVGAEAKRFADTRERIQSGDSITWSYKWGYIWSLGIL